jgi:chemotaxis protein CheX
MSTFDPALSYDYSRGCWLPALQLSVQEVFGLMLGCALEVPHGPPLEQGLGVVAMVGLAGQLCGIVTLRCSSSAAARMASLMLGIDTGEVGSQRWDAVGELCNMIAGNFKYKISGLGDNCFLSVPTVITGEDYSLHAIASEEIHNVLLFEGESVVVGLEVHH